MRTLTMQHSSYALHSASAFPFQSIRYFASKLQAVRIKASDVSHQSFRLFASKHQMFRIKASGCSHQNIRFVMQSFTFVALKLQIYRINASTFLLQTLQALTFLCLTV
jgi:hypothetical protein